MTGWDVFSNIYSSFPPMAAGLLLITASIVFIVGFSNHGLNFLKYGFKQKEITGLSAKIDGFKTELEAKIDGLKAEMNAKMDGFKTEMNGFKAELSSFKIELGGFKTELGELRTEMDGFRGELETIKVNHFGHLKGFLTELTSILVDKGVINNENKARLDNQLWSM